VLKGERPIPSAGIRIGRALVVALAFAPLVVLTAIVVKRATGGHGPGESGSSSQTALLFLIVYGVMLYLGLWRMTRLTVRRFMLDGGALDFETPRHGRVSLPVTDLRSITEELQGRHGRSLRGWWLWFVGVGSVYLPLDLPNADLLVGELGSLVGYDAAGKRGTRK
jgi:hypothetical protein